MDIYLIRHTKPDVEEGICYGQQDLALASSFEEECKKVRNKLRHDFTKVYSSPLQRCSQLAKGLFGDEIIFDERLKEIHMADWEMRRWDELEKIELDRWMKDFVTIKTPNGESFEDLRIRVMLFFNALFEESHENVAVVCHGGVIRTVLATILGLPLCNVYNLFIDYGGISMIRIKNGQIKVRFVNL